MLSAFLRHYGSEKRSVNGRCMCSRNRGGKKVICKKWTLSAVSGILRHFKWEFRKKRYVVIFPIKRSGRMQKSKKKKKRKIFYATFFLAVFLFPIIKRAEKVTDFVYFRKGRGKM